MVHCVVPICKQRTGKSRKKNNGVKVSFHVFPADTSRKEEWARNIGLKVEAINQHSRICSKHFSEKMFDRTSLSCIRLRAFAIPHLNLTRAQKPMVNLPIPKLSNKVEEMNPLQSSKGLSQHRLEHKEIAIFVQSHSRPFASKGRSNSPDLIVPEILPETVIGSSESNTEIPKQMNLGSTWSLGNSSKWKDIEISGTKYIISAIQENGKWKIMLSNLVEIWTEVLTLDIALRRCQKLNPCLDTDSFDVHQILKDILNDIPKHAVNKSVTHIVLRTIIEGGIFTFTLDLTKSNPQQFYEVITRPLCHSLMEVQRRYAILLDLVKRKDEEIAEYKAGGAELIRKNIETEIYHDSLFETKSSTCDITDCIDAFRTITDLYTTDAFNVSEEEKRSDVLVCTSSCGSTAELQVRVKTEVEISESVSADCTSRQIPPDMVMPKTEIADAVNSNTVEQQINSNISDDDHIVKVEHEIDLHVQSSTDKKETTGNVTSIASSMLKKPVKRPRKRVNINDFIS